MHSQHDYFKYSWPGNSQQESELKEVINSLVDAVITINEKGEVESFNSSAEAMFGYQADEMIGRNIKILMPEPDSPHHDAFINDYMNKGGPKVIGIGRELVAKRKNGETFPIRLSVSELPGKSGGLTRFVGSCTDLTEYRKMEDAIRQSRKLEAVGEDHLGRPDETCSGTRLPHRRHHPPSQGR